MKPAGGFLRNTEADQSVGRREVNAELATEPYAG
jgi:hypothetical protein